MKDVHATIVRLLSNMASTREIQLYLKRFSQVDAARFAVVKVGAAVLRDDLAALVSSLAFLQQVGLTPIVVHGGAAGEVPETRAGHHVTAAELAAVRRSLQQENLRLVEALQAEGVRATSLHSGVFECAYLGKRRHGFAGKVMRVDTAGVQAATEVGSIPVVAAIGETRGGQILDIDTDQAANELIERLQPYKIIFLTAAGGLVDGSGRVIESVSLTTEYDELIRQPWLAPGAAAEIRRIHDLLMQLPPSTSLSITRPDEMAKELFTHRGSGTLVRRGEQIRAHASWKGVDLSRLRALVESSFGRALTPHYFERTEPVRVYVSEHYRSAIVLTREDGLVYMDKFAVTDEAQGEGLGRATWQVMRAENPHLFWRSRVGNAVNDFYFANADGAVKDVRWVVFWCGLDDWERIRTAVEHARTRPATLLG